MGAPVEARGEATIVLDGATFGLRPTYAAIVALEEATGLTIGTMALAAAQLRLPLAKLALVVATLIRAWGEAAGDRVAARVDTDRIGQLIMGSSASEASAAVAKLLHGAATGGYTPLGEARPATTTTTG